MILYLDVRHRNGQAIGHVPRGNSVVRNVIEDRMDGRKDERKTHKSAAGLNDYDGSTVHTHTHTHRHIKTYSLHLGTRRRTHTPEHTRTRTPTHSH